MPRKRVGRTKRAIHVLTGDFAQALEGFKEVSGLTWAEIARRLGTSVVNLWRWRQGVQPNMHHLIALQDLADGHGPGTPAPQGEGARSLGRRSRTGSRPVPTPTWNGWLGSCGFPCTSWTTGEASAST